MAHRVGSSFTEAEADCAVFDRLVAMMVTVCCVVTLEGAVYNPAALIMPVPAGLIVHDTFVLFTELIIAVYCSDCPAYSSILDGVMLIPVAGGISVIVAEADCVGSTWLVAMILTVSCVVSPSGTVYKPVELIIPTSGYVVHVTAELLAPLIVALNCCD